MAGEIDFAVHSYKDLPTTAHPALHIAAVPVREDPRDVRIAPDNLTLTELPPGAMIGTLMPGCWAARPGVDSVTDSHCVVAGSGWSMASSKSK